MTFVEKAFGEMAFGEKVCSGNGLSGKCLQGNSFRGEKVFGDVAVRQIPYIMHASDVKMTIINCVVFVHSRHFSE